MGDLTSVTTQPKSLSHRRELARTAHEDLLGGSVEVLVDDMDNTTNSWFEGDCKDCILGLVREPLEQRARAARACMEGWGVEKHGLITCLMHQTEQERECLIDKYEECVAKY